MPYTSPKPQIQNLSQQLSRTSSLLSPLLVASNDKYPRAILMQLAFFIKKLNRH